MNKEKPTPGSGDHILVLAMELPPPASRLLKQIGSLVRLGHRVSLLATTEDHQLDREPDISEKRDFWSQVRSSSKDPLLDCPGARKQLQTTLRECVQQYDRKSQDRAYAKKALRSLRTLFSLHWSREVRREGRQKHREFRARTMELVARDDKATVARWFNAVSWYEIGAQGYVEGSPESARRVSDVGVPSTIHVHDAFTLTSGVLLVRRWRARLVYDAYEHEPERAH